jgi:hypothetical protein
MIYSLYPFIHTYYKVTITKNQAFVTKTLETIAFFYGSYDLWE